MAKSAKSKSKSKKENKVPFMIIASLLGFSILIPVVLLIFSTVFNDKATEEFTKSLYPVKYESYVEKSAREFDVDVCLIYGVIRTESNFNPDAVSNVGAIGLMQIMPETFSWLQNYRAGFQSDKLMDSDKLYNPKTNIEYGTFFLSYLLDRYDGDTSLAICAYNAGHGNVDSWIADGTIPDHDVTSEDIPFEETSNYLTRVTESMEMYRTLYFTDMDTDTSSVDTESLSDDESNDVSEDENAFGDEGFYGENENENEFDGNGEVYNDENVDINNYEVYNYDDGYYDAGDYDNDEVYY